jgi:hypothetical protein
MQDRSGCALRRRGFTLHFRNSNFPVVPRPRRLRNDCSPLWDVNVGWWTQQAVAQQYRSRLTEELQILTFVQNGSSPDPAVPRTDLRVSSSTRQSHSGSCNAATMLNPFDACVAVCDTRRRMIGLGGRSSRPNDKIAMRGHDAVAYFTDERGTKATLTMPRSTKAREVPAPAPSADIDYCAANQSGRDR